MSEQRYKGVIAWFAYNPVAANLLMLVIIAVGIGSALSLIHISEPTRPKR